jgi:uracil-DNA glycosylase
VDLWNLVPDVWQPYLTGVQDHIAAIESDLDLQTDAGMQINPPRGQIFASLRVAPKDVRVVILGQDPYPNAEHAMGLCFSVPAGTRPLPPSLRNILTELAADVGQSQVVNGSLEPWVDEGVLLLNRVLTVESGKSNSHQALGWQAVTEAILRAVVDINPGVVGVLWGSAAQQARMLFRPECLIESVHPSPLSAYRGFLGSKPFSTVNDMLAKRNEAPILW